MRVVVQKCLVAWIAYYKNVVDKNEQEVVQVRRRIAVRAWYRRADRRIVLRGRAWTVTNRLQLRLLHRCHTAWQTSWHIASGTAGFDHLMAPLRMKVTFHQWAELAKLERALEHFRAKTLRPALKGWLRVFYLKCHAERLETTRHAMVASLRKWHRKAHDRHMSEVGWGGLKIGWVAWDGVGWDAGAP